MVVLNDQSWQAWWENDDVAGKHEQLACSTVSKGLKAVETAMQVLGLVHSGIGHH